MTHSLEAPGGPLKYSLDGHDFAVFGCALTTDQRYVISTSTRDELSQHSIPLSVLSLVQMDLALKVN